MIVVSTGNSLFFSYHCFCFCFNLRKVAELFELSQYLEEQLLQSLLFYVFVKSSRLTSGASVSLINLIGEIFRFCFECIDNWSTIMNLCPLCQREFQLITCVPVSTLAFEQTEHFSSFC